MKDRVTTLINRLKTSIKCLPDSTVVSDVKMGKIMIEKDFKTKDPQCLFETFWISFYPTSKPFDTHLKQKYA